MRLFLLLFPFSISKIFFSCPFHVGASKLQTLSLKNNKIATVKDLQGLVGLRLQKLDLTGNPVETDPKLAEFLSQIVVA